MDGVFALVVCGVVLGMFLAGIFTLLWDALGVLIGFAPLTEDQSGAVFVIGAVMTPVTLLLIFLVVVGIATARAQR